HYHEPIDFSVRRVEEAESKLLDWQRAAKGAEVVEGGQPDASVIAELADDLNFHRASVALDVIAKKANRNEGNARHCLAATLKFLGFSLDSLLTSEDGWEAPAHIATAIAERLQALNNKDFARADAIRNELAEQGIALLDYKHENGERATKWEVKR